MAEEVKQPERVFTFTFGEAHANLILAALGELPFKQVADVVNLIHSQANAQLARENQRDEG